MADSDDWPVGREVTREEANSADSMAVFMRFCQGAFFVGAVTFVCIFLQTMVQAPDPHTWNHLWTGPAAVGCMIGFGMAGNHWKRCRNLEARHYIQQRDARLNEVLEQKQAAERNALMWQIKAGELEKKLQQVQQIPPDKV